MANKTIERYGAIWNDEGYKTDLKIEMGAIKLGGTWKDKAGNACGMGLSHHYEQMRRCLWPELDGDHNGQRWHTLCRNEILKNKVTVLMGSGSSGKTHSCWIYLCEYLCFPEETCVLISSTHIDGLRLRVWAEITMLWQKAVDKFDFLAGHLLDSKILISTDDLSEDEFDERRVRDWRKGIKGIPCVQNGKFIGLSKFQGIKQKRMRLIADEAALMGGAFLSSFSNLDKNEDFRAIVLGNPSDPLDPLGKAAEPVDGWTSHMEPEKTTVWNTRFMSGRCVNLVGTDSPNFDFSADQPTRFKYLISREKIANTLSFFSKDSFEYYSQCVGVMKVGMLSRRVITRDLCRQFQATEDVIWKGTGTTKVYALDSAYGGDRAVGGWGEFGEDITGKTILCFHPPSILPVKVGVKSPEDQLAERVKSDCVGSDIPPDSMFHDATGRGSLGTSLAREWSAQTNPVEFGGSPTDRPVCLDLFVIDPVTKQKRLKTCKEHYSKFVTELWFSVRYAIEAGQVRGLTEDVIEEGCMREWNRVKGDKIEIETKVDMKERVGRSPDLFDWASIIVEGARRKGFNISKLANAESEMVNREWVREAKEKQREFTRRFSLNYSS